MKKYNRHTVTAALPYANGPVHIGHLAGVYVPADIYVRYLRSKKRDVVFICGSDEHGVAIELRAKKENKSPQELVDHYHQMIKKSFDEFGINFDIYFRTSDPLHHQTASEFFSNLLKKGKFIEKESDQFYDPKDDQFLPDRYIIGRCPICDFEEAYGDQCEKCGSTLSPQEIKNPKSIINGNTPVLKETKHWYLPLHKYQEEWMNGWITEKKEVWRSSVYGQCKSWLNAGLMPRPMTRDLNWGVRVNVGNEHKVLYVWFDAPIGYISATKKWAKDHQKDWKDYWKKEDTQLVHFIGKDNIVFHCIIFPAILKAEGSFILPTDVPANEFLNLEGKKISTSRNWAVWLHEYLQDFPHKQDVLRYVLTSNAPETKDNDFTWKDYQSKNNNELVAILGNFIRRTFTLTEKYFDERIPRRQNNLLSIDTDLLKTVDALPKKIEKLIMSYRFRDALACVMQLARLGNKYLTQTEPWKNFGKKTDRVRTNLNLCVHIIVKLSVCMDPFLPFTAAKLRKSLGISSFVWDDVYSSEKLINYEGKLLKLDFLFEKIEDPIIEKQLDKLKDVKKAQENSHVEKKKRIPVKESMSFDDFSKMDLRVGQIIAAEKIVKSDKLLKLLVDMGFEQRIIVSGIAKEFKIGELVNKKVAVLVNLAPRKIMGMESNGMLLFAKDQEGKLLGVFPDSKTENGAIIS